VSAETLGETDPSPEAGQAPASDEGFFRADGDLLVPAPFATSPWGQVLHGRLIGGLTARAVERARAADPGLACSRLTIDMFRSAAMSPVRVVARPVREGRRIAVIEVTVEQGGVPVGQGKALLLRRAEQPAGPFRPAPAWDAPAPSQLGPPRSSSTSRWTAPWQSWPVAGPAGPGNPDDPAVPVTGGMWLRDVHPLVAGEPLTPLVRAAMAADLASPVSNYSAHGLSFINADYTLYLGRAPHGEYIGIQPAWHLSEAGVAAGQCVLHDENGPVGFVATAAVANQMTGARPAPA
jgi:Acyl-CoA thioesterase N-terminal domain/Acyl-CoA thioesterase C-terminal domain